MYRSRAVTTLHYKAIVEIKISFFTRITRRMSKKTSHEEVLVKRYLWKVDCSSYY